MKVILLRDMAKLGKRGEVKDVAEGYAINVLIKKGDAALATPGELAKWKAKEEQTRLKKDTALATFSSLLSTLRTKPITITGKKYDSKKQLFASIKEADIADAIFASTNVSFDPKQITIASPIKSLGQHVVELKQGGQKEKITLTVE